MGEFIFHFDLEPLDEKIRVDYRWSLNGNEYMIENIPCTDYPFMCVPEKKEYMSKEVSETLSILIHLLETDDAVPNTVDFMTIED